jgi:hypothetical protein
MATPEWVPVIIDRPEFSGEFKFEAYEEDGRIVCGIYDLVGKKKAGPKAVVEAIREEVRRLESAARAHGAQEFRLGGRWGRILPDFELFPDPSDPLRRRKVLT